MKSVLCLVLLARLAASAPAEHTSAWSVNADGRLFATFNHQGGRRGSTEFRSQNWFMLMADHPLGPGELTLSAMFSLEPITARNPGYAEIFQEGEAYRGRQITDHQHPHDLFDQLAAVWRIPIGDRSSVSVAGGPVGEAALGPVSFMHRASAAENPTAPLSHHIFDSTHISSGVVLSRLDAGMISVEGSIFRGLEPDEYRYDLDTGKLDSWSGRVWLRPGPAWTIQASYGFLHEPEALEPGDQRRTNASASWFRERGGDYSAVTVAVGQIARRYSVVHALLAEATSHFGATSLYSRFEQTQVETEILLFPEIVHKPHPGELVDWISAVTAGIVRDVATIGRVGIGIGGDVTFYGVPDLLQVTHGAHPVSAHAFVRLGRAALDGRMWNTTMASPGHGGMEGMH